MSSSQSSASILVQHSPVPPHSLTSPFSPDPEPERLSQPSIMSQTTFPEPDRPSSPQPEAGLLPLSPEMADTPMVDAPAADTEPQQEPQTDTQQGGEPQPQSAGEDPAQPDNGVAAPPTDGPPPNDPEGPAPVEILPPPPDPRNDPPEWVLFEDDLSKPTPEEEEQLNLLESRGIGTSALDVARVEKLLYTDLDDPDTRPIKKLRLSWVIKGVRGTKDKPNYARVMTSPPALIDGTYWQIKFYPRGNKVPSYSAYIRCSKRPPKVDREAPEGSFSYFEGPPDADFGAGAVAAQVPKVTPVGKKDKRSSSTSSVISTTSRKQDGSEIPAAAVVDDAEALIDEGREVQDVREPESDWRVSAQLGVVVYNPAEPRTNVYNTCEHQFSRHTDDWGWASIAAQWKETHVRQPCQRAPLLQNDTLAIDVYIRIFDDSTKALWWRSSDGEPHWDSKALAGYFPMGTPPLYHSPAVAGMTAWLLLAPFRKLLQEADAGEWQRDSQVRPKPFIAQLQMTLYFMRSLRKESETYVDLYPTIQAMKYLGEGFVDVKTFWEAFRRSIELEMEGNDKCSQGLSKMFDTPDGPFSLPPLPVENVLDIQQTLGQVLREKNFSGVLPNFLPLMLARDYFDKKSREWKLRHDCVVLNDELDMSGFIADEAHSKYTLYGFMVHAGARHSGKFYTVLRPKGPNTMWLAFEDGDGNQVFSYSRKSLKPFEGLEGQALKDFNSTRSTAYMAMYIKTSCLAEYLPGSLEPYKLPEWLLPQLDSSYQEPPDNAEKDESVEQPAKIQVEIYSDAGLVGREGLLDMYNIRQQAQMRDYFYILSSPATATYQELRQQLAQKLELDGPESIRIFVMGYSDIGNYSSAQLVSARLKDQVGNGRARSQPLCLWMSVLKDKEEIAFFGEPDRSLAEPEEANPDSRENPVVPENVPNSPEEQVAGPDAEQTSIEEAVVADVVQSSSGAQQLSAVAVEINDADTAMQLDVSPPSAEESLNTDVPHGHLIDAAAHDDVAAVLANDEALVPSGPEPLGLSPAEDAIIAAVIAQDVEAMDIVMESGSESTHRSHSEASESSSHTSSPPPEKDERPVDNVYGFIQMFDVEKQLFRVEGTFFAKADDNIRDFLQKRLGYDAGKSFAVWRRQSTIDGVLVGSDETFREPRFVNGTDIVIYEPVTEGRTNELEKAGKFTTPDLMSQNLQAVERRHPIRSVSTNESIELADFGTDYYRGPLLHGQCHGAHCLSISPSGNTYEGPLICGIKSGKGGTMIYCNGDTFEGEWYNDERHGQGTFVEARTGNKYVGGFENGKRWGMGTTYWQVADEQADLCQICYGNEIDALFFDCGHVCACVECARQCELCPICRKPVKQVVKMFRS